MRAVLVMLVAAGGGCFIVPKTTHTPTVVFIEDHDIVPAPRTMLGLELASHGSLITLQASSPRVCVKETWHVLDVKHEREADLAVELLNDPYAALGAFILAPITLAVSGVVTAIIIGSSHTTTTRDRKRVARTPYECPAFGGDLAVSMTLPSGTVAETRTNVYGAAHFHVPPGEPDRGDITVRVGELPARVVHYCRAACGPER